MWGSVVGLILVSGTLLQTWLYPLVNLWSGLACITVLTLIYAFLKPRRKAGL
jgi:hypothetical protein